ncbi:hypothetical protein PspLS_10192 [Pyricularia sp. CBS 133598]|nr:hypothetical protein PspLS_10192 [Pyricularia sp. CBS 133598]
MIPSRPERGGTQDRIPSSVGAECGQERLQKSKSRDLHATSEPSHVSTASGNVSVATPNRGRSQGRGDDAQTGPTGYVYFPRFVTNYNFWASQYIERV